MKKKNSIRKPSASSASGRRSGIGLAAACVKAQAVVLLTGLALLLVFCAIAASMEDPDSVLRPLSLCALFLSTFAGGFAAVRMSGDGVMSGICAGAVSVVLVLLLSLLPFADSEAEFSGNLLMYLCMIASSAAGAMIGKRRKPNKSPMARAKKR